MIHFPNILLLMIRMHFLEECSNGRRLISKEVTINTECYPKIEGEMQLPLGEELKEGKRQERSSLEITYP